MAGLILYIHSFSDKKKKISGIGAHGYSYNELIEVKKDDTLNLNGCPSVPTPKGYVQKKIYMESISMSGLAAIAGAAFVDIPELWEDSVVGTPPDRVAVIETYYDYYGAVNSPINEDRKKLLGLFLEAVYKKNIPINLDDFNSIVIITPPPPVASDDYYQEVFEKHNVPKDTLNNIKIISNNHDSIGIGESLLNSQRGLSLAKNNNKKNKYNYTESPVKKYWSNSYSPHPILCGMSRFYFNTKVAQPTSSKGHYCYYTSRSAATKGSKDTDDYIGKPETDICGSVCYLEEPVPLLDTVIKRHDKFAWDKYKTIVRGRLDNILSSKSVKDIEEDDGKLIHCLSQRKSDPIMTALPSGKELSCEITPPFRVFNFIKELSLLEDLLNEHINGNDDCLIHDKIDITNYFYMMEDTKKGKKCKCLIPSNQPNIVLDYGNTSAGKGLSLDIGLDTAIQRTISKLASYSPKVYLVVYDKKDTMFRYATLFEYGNNYSIYSSLYANRHFINM